MKYINFLIGFLVVIIVFFLYSQKIIYANDGGCLTRTVTFNSDPSWTGDRQISVQCFGDSHPGAHNCTGETDNISSGQSVNMNTCSCNIPPGDASDGCIHINTQAPAGCNYNISGPECGVNGQHLDEVVTASCTSSNPNTNPNHSQLQCSASCSNNSDCASGFCDSTSATCRNPSCITDQSCTCNNPQITPAPTPPAGQCLQTCNGSGQQTCYGSQDANGNCVSSVDQSSCSVCSSQPNQSPLECNAPCSSNDQCQGNQNGCTQCLADNNGNSTCQPASGETPTETPTLAPGVTPSSTPTLPPGITPTPTLPPGVTPTVPLGKLTPTPTPGFNPSECQCDGIDVTALFPGQPFEVHGFAKVVGDNRKFASVSDMIFIMTKNNTIINQSGPIVPVIVSSNNNTDRYKSTWDSKMPSNVDTSATYRLFVQQIDCKQKNPSAAGFLADTQVSPPSIMQRIINFFETLFSLRRQTASSVQPKISQTVSVQPTVNATNDSSTTSNSIHLKSLVPAKIAYDTNQKNCKFIRFTFPNQ